MEPFCASEWFEKSAVIQSLRNPEVTVTFDEPARPIERESLDKNSDSLARHIALSFALVLFLIIIYYTKHLTKVKSFGTDTKEVFLVNFKKKLNHFNGKAQLLDAALVNIPYVTLEKIAKLFENDEELKNIITEEMLNRSMKCCEFITRRRRLQRQIMESKQDKLLRLKQQGVGFIPIYSTNGHALPSFRTRKLTAAELEHPFIESQSECEYPKQSVVNSCSVVPQLRYFQRHFEIFSQSPIITKVLSPSVLAMGGAVLACLLPPPKDILELHELLDL